MIEKFVNNVKYHYVQNKKGDSARHETSKNKPETKKAKSRI